MFTIEGKGAEVVCRSCGRTYDRTSGKEIKGRTRIFDLSDKYRISYIVTGNTSMISVYDKAFGDMFPLNEEEASKLKKFLSEVI